MNQKNESELIREPLVNVNDVLVKAILSVL